MGITNNTSVFVWEGEEVGLWGEAVSVGELHEPILLSITYHAPQGEGLEGGRGEEGECELVSGFSKSSTLGELRVGAVPSDALTWIHSAVL